LKNWPFPIDPHPTSSDNGTMSTETLRTGNPELNEAIARLMNGKRDPEAARKACERMDRMREETRQRVGTVDFAVSSIRELRDQ
jgi:hypothetical protein